MHPNQTVALQPRPALSVLAAVARFAPCNRYTLLWRESMSAVLLRLLGAKLVRRERGGLCRMAASTPWLDVMAAGVTDPWRAG